MLTKDILASILLGLCASALAAPITNLQRGEENDDSYTISAKFKDYDAEKCEDPIFSHFEKCDAKREDANDDSYEISAKFKDYDVEKREEFDPDSTYSVSASWSAYAEGAKEK